MSEQLSLHGEAGWRRRQRLMKIVGEQALKGLTKIDDIEVRVEPLIKPYSIDRSKQ